MKGFDNSFEVCHCQNVTLGEIIYTIKEEGARTLGQIQDATRAGTECRCCMFEEADTSQLKKKLYCKEILKFYTKGKE